MGKDMCVACDDGILNLRVGAIILKDDRILMVGNERSDYLYSVGGRIKFGEVAEEAVVREVLEETGVYEDFYVEPAFRGKGIARKLAQAAQAWCKDNGISSLTVCCAPCDEKMYQALGFDIALGTTFAHIE